ncbi:uncharacterized protein BJX67DRAFT_227666 [Aspergillus lucknowensis]|uniref:DUF7492 domain-containing protein n=1 Tax=Aspergillus lucknowensis TaxID=176173 RepID=A0ABR4LI47_9EURO
MMDGSRSMGSMLILLALFFTPACAHSWVEQLMVIAPNGTFVGSPGYPRGYVSRSEPTFSDTEMSYLLPPTGETKATLTDNMCKKTQRKQVQSDGSPRLQASAGAAIALRYQENGHVTLPDTQIGKPHNRGTVYVYGTTDPKDDEKFLDVHKVWNEDGTGGDRRGVLLAKRNYDDGRCYQINSGQISQHRQALFPHEADQYMGADVWCQSDVAIPANAPSGKPYTLYWVWDWPTAPRADPGLPNGKQEIYTTCMDVDVVAGSDDLTRVAAKYIEGQSLNSASMPDQFEEILNSKSGVSADSSSPVPMAESPSNPVTTAPPEPTAVPPVATVTVTSFVTSVKIVWERDSP